MRWVFDRLRWIDETSRGEHRFLTPADHCLYFGEFRSGAGFRGGVVNQLIIDFKRGPAEIGASARASALRYYKERALWRIADGLRHAFGAAAIEQSLTFVPIPTSKLPGQPDHCDRLPRALGLAFAGLDADIRPLLRQRASTMADHHRGGRRSRHAELLAITELDHAQLQRPLRPLVVLFDDVLTSGKHLSVAKIRIRERFPDQAIISVLVARRIMPVRAA
jgi:hypothetical protein